MPALPTPHFYHQLGSQEHLLGLEMLHKGFGSGAILSPRDLHQSNWKESKLPEFAPKYRATDRELLIDPQAYDPNQIQIQDDILFGNTKGLASHPDISPFIAEELQRQQALGVTQYIVPGTFTEAISEDWLNLHFRFGEVARQWCTGENETRRLLSTIAVHASQVRNEETRKRLLNDIVNIPSDGVYLVIGEVIPRTMDVQGLIGVLDVIFRLKWAQKSVLLAYSGAWSMLGFPLGLDSFASSGIKNRQSFLHEDWRTEKPKKGGGGPSKKFNDLWSPLMMDYLRYPDDADLLDKTALDTVCASRSPYSPPLDQSPSAVFARKGWQKGVSHKDFSWKMWDLTREFENTGYRSRIATVRAKLKSADEYQKQIASRLQRNKPNYINAWQDAFETYIGSIAKELSFLFD